MNFRIGTASRNHSHGPLPRISPRSRQSTQVTGLLRFTLLNTLEIQILISRSVIAEVNALLYIHIRLPETRTVKGSCAGCYRKSRMLTAAMVHCHIPLRPTFHKPSFGLTCRLVLRHSILATLHHETQITVFLKTFHCPFSLTNRSNQPSPHKESQEFPTYCKARSRSALIPGSDKSVMPGDFG